MTHPATLAAYYRERAEREGNPADLIHAQHLERQAAAMHDPHQAAEAAAFTLAHTNNQPRTTSAQTALF
jgi:hypothetical protein